MHHNLENSTFDSLKYTMESPILIVSIYMGKSIRIQSVNNWLLLLRVYLASSSSSFFLENATMVTWIKTLILYTKGHRNDAEPTQKHSNIQSKAVMADIAYALARNECNCY